IGANQELKIAQDGTHNITYMQNVGPLQLQTDDLRLYNYSTQDLYLRAQTNAGVSLWYDYSNHSTAKLTTTATGVTIDGTAVAGGLDISGDIDVDGHTNLDNVNIAGVTTTTGDITIDGLHSGGSSRMLNIGSGNNILRIYENSSQAAQIYTQGNLVLTGATTEIRSKSGSNQLEASFHATNGVKLYHDNNEKLFVNGSGVNITGVTTITGSGSSVLFLESSNPMIRLTDTDNNVYSSIGGESGHLYFYTNTSTRDVIFRGSQEVARLTGDGLLGIGTVNPDRMLHIRGTGNAVVKMEADYSGSVTGIEGVLTASGADRYVTGIYGKVVNTSGTESNVANIRLWNQQASPTTSDSPGYITFSTTNDGANSATEKLRIESGGGLKFTGQGTSIPVGGI
ncbi:MAG: hypothetical protein VXY93_11515, partial [Pseudomonadota bacterium]|nr:hypothetical protein [Pseudomonadota bacterium]